MMLEDRNFWLRPMVFIEAPNKINNILSGAKVAHFEGPVHRDLLNEGHVRLKL